MSQRGHSEQLLFFSLFYRSTPSCLKVRGGVGWSGGGLCDYCVSPAQRIGFLGFLAPTGAKGEGMLCVRPFVRDILQINSENEF